MATGSTPPDRLRSEEAAAAPRRGRRPLLLAALALAAGTLLPATAPAQTWPVRPVKIVVPFATGGPADNCTQVTEILITPGIRLAGLLPAPHGLSTVYTGAVGEKGIGQDLALALLAGLTGPEAAPIRQQAGFG